MEALVNDTSRVSERCETHHLQVSDEGRPAAGLPRTLIVHAALHVRVLSISLAAHLRGQTVTALMHRMRNGPGAQAQAEARVAHKKRGTGAQAKQGVAHKKRGTRSGIRAGVADEAADPTMLLGA